MSVNTRRGPDGRGSSRTEPAQAGSQPAHVTATPQWWAGQLLSRLGYPLTPANIEAIVAWEAAEGGHWNNSADFNPLNTTENEPGAHAMNSVGVKAYTSWQEGLDATVATLRNGRYAPILAALKSGDNPGAVTTAVTSSPWGTHSISLGAAASYADYSRSGDSPVATSGLAPAPAAATGATTVVDAGTQLPPDPTPAQIDSYIESNYGYLAAFLKDPAVAPLLTYAARKQLNPDEIRGLLTDTSNPMFPKAVAWYAKTSQSARQFEADAVNDPATQAQQVAQARADLARQAQTLGIPVAGGRLQQLAEDSLKYGWDTGQAQTALAAEFHYNPKVNYGGTAGQSIDALRARATGDYLVPISDHTLGLWTQQILAGTKTSADFDTYLQSQAKNMYPTISAALDGGMTTAQYLDPYMQTAETTLERPFTAADFLNNPRFSKALNTTTADGVRAPMSLSDWQTYLRGLPEYQTTSGARQQASDMALHIAETFGQVAS